jgi:hypothetical protein
MNNCDDVCCVAPVPREIPEITDHIRTRHNISLRFETFGSDTSAQLLRTPEDFAQLLYKRNSSNIKVVHVVTEIRTSRTVYGL